MATSGSVNFSLSVRQIITDALEEIGVISIGDTPSAEDAAKALGKLNLMLKTWGTNEKLWIKTEGSVTLLASTASYATSPVSLARRIDGVRRRTSNVDTPLTMMSREEYLDFPSKTATGVPFGCYFDPQRATRTLYVVGVPDATIAASTTLRIDYRRVIEDADDLDNDLDIPQEWLEACSAGLAARLVTPYRVHVTDPGGAAAIMQRAADLYAQLTADSQEDGSVFFQPA